jgi:hypothetical protein
MPFAKKFALPVAMCTALALATFGGTAHAGPPGPPQVELPVPSLSCVSSTPTSITIQVCGGAVYGAPNGFSIHVKKLSDYLVDGWDQSTSYRCYSFSGNCGGGNNPWNLSAGECVNVTISASTIIDVQSQGFCGASSNCDNSPLLCNTEYVFNVFAHGGDGNFNRSDFSSNLQCSTAPCVEDGGCTLTWGYWKTHGPVGCSPGNQVNDWDLATLNVGGLSLSQAQACDILQQNPAACGKGGGANAVLILEHQLIAAMLNVANDAISCPFANQAIVDANALLAGREYDCVGVASVLGQQMIAVKNLLAAYNEDICSCPVPAGAPQDASAPSNVRKTTWGKAKSIYR